MMPIDMDAISRERADSDARRAEIASLRRASDYAPPTTETGLPETGLIDYEIKRDTPWMLSNRATSIRPRS